MKKSVIFCLVILLVALALTGGCGKKKQKPTVDTGSGAATRPFDSGRITISGTKDQLDKIAGVEVIQPGDSRYPQPGDVGAGIQQVIHVFEIKPKSGQGPIAPPSLTLDDFVIAATLWESIQPPDKTLPIYRYVSANNWGLAGESWLKGQKPHAWGRIDHASLFAVVEMRDEEPPVVSPEEVIAEGVARLVEAYAPEGVWLNPGAQERPYPQAVELTAAYFEEYGVKAIEPGADRDRIIVMLQAGEAPDVTVLLLPSEQWDGMMAMLEEWGLDVPVFAYTEETGQPEWTQLKD
jgi:hypothetical protein